MSQKPQAASHMFWFFILPCVVFLFWASFKLVKVSTEPKVPKDVFARLGDIREAKSPGDRWQAAYSLSQELQQMIREGKLAQLEATKKDQLFSELHSLLDKHSTDTRLKRYLLLTLGQTGDDKALPALEKYISDKDSEVKFFATWGLVEVLSRNPASQSPTRLENLAKLLKDPDASLRKIAATFLVQQKNTRYRTLVSEQLKDPNVEVRWNAAVALASVKDASAVPVLGEIFELEKLRAVDFKSGKDLEQIVAAAAIAARKLENAEVLSKAAALKAHAEKEASTPEGKAILNGLRI